MKAKKKPQPKRIRLPDLKSLRLANQVLNKNDFSQVGLGQMLLQWHHELGMTTDNIARSWGVPLEILHIWMTWYQVKIIEDFGQLPIRSFSELKQAREFRQKIVAKGLIGQTHRFISVPGNEESLDVFLKDIGKIPLLTKREEHEIAHYINHGYEKQKNWAVNEITIANLRFVVSVAKQYQGRGLLLADLINEGILGCIKAAGRFDPKLGYRFISYAVWWIRQAILQSIAELGHIVRLPQNRKGVMSKVSQAAIHLEQELSRLPAAEELSNLLGITESETLEAQQLANTHMSLDAPFRTDDYRSDSLIDTLEDSSQAQPDQRLIDQSLSIELDKALDSLTPKEAEVISLYFGLNKEGPLTLEEIGARFKFTRERARQIKEKALNRLRHVSRSRNLIDFFDQHE